MPRRPSQRAAFEAEPPWRMITRPVTSVPRSSPRSGASTTSSTRSPTTTTRGGAAPRRRAPTAGRRCGRRPGRGRLGIGRGYAAGSGPSDGLGAGGPSFRTWRVPASRTPDVRRVHLRRPKSGVERANCSICGPSVAPGAHLAREGRLFRPKVPRRTSGPCAGRRSSSDRRSLVMSGKASGEARPPAPRRGEAARPRDEAARRARYDGAPGAHHRADASIAHRRPR